MKRLLSAVLLTTAASCALLFAPADLIPAGPGSPVAALTERAVDRHDAYVEARLEAEMLEPEMAATFLAEAAQALSLVSTLTAVQVDALTPSLVPVMGRHDSYVASDASLDAIGRGIYLESTARLRAIIQVAEAGRRGEVVQ